MFWPQESIFVTGNQFLSQEINFSQGCAIPVFARWDWDWDSLYPVSIFDTETETFKIGLKNWDWYWDFCLWYQKLRLRPSAVSNIETDTETFDLEKKVITLFDPDHTF